MSDHDEKVTQVLGAAADAASALGNALPMPARVIAIPIAGILRTVARAMQRGGKSAEQIIREIDELAPVDTSYRSEVDEAIADKPSRGEG